MQAMLQAEVTMGEEDDQRVYEQEDPGHPLQGWVAETPLPAWGPARPLYISHGVHGSPISPPFAIKGPSRWLSFWACHPGSLVQLTAGSEDSDRVCLFFLFSSWSASLQSHRDKVAASMRYAGDLKQWYLLATWPSWPPHWSASLISRPNWLQRRLWRSRRQWLPCSGCLRCCYWCRCC